MLSKVEECFVMQYKQICWETQTIQWQNEKHENKTQITEQQYVQKHGKQNWHYETFLSCHLVSSSPFANIYTWNRIHTKWPVQALMDGEGTKRIHRNPFKKTLLRPHHLVRSFYIMDEKECSGRSKCGYRVFFALLCMLVAQALV